MTRSQAITEALNMSERYAKAYYAHEKPDGTWVTSDACPMNRNWESIKCYKGVAERVVR